jgi:hypothetical protein
VKFLGVEILETIISFFQTIRNSLALEYLLYIFVGLEILTIIIFIFVVYNVYELKLMRAIDKLNAYLYHVQYIDDSNLIEFNNRMKRVPKTLRYHWQQYMLYREKMPSYYMSVENCVDRPIKSSAFSANIKIIKSLGIVYAILSFIFCCGWAAGLSVVSTDYFITIFIIPLVVLFLNYMFLIVLNAKKASNTRDLYQTFHIFNRFIDKAVTTLPEYVDFEVLFTRKEIKRGIPVLNEYIEKRQIQEQEEMRKAKENAVQHELYNFEEAEEKGELVLERAMKETEILINLKNRLNIEIEQIEKEIDSYKRTYDNTTKDYQKKLQASKENIERLREQQESTTNRIESNYIRKQQSDEIKKQQQIEKEQDDATLRFNQEINTLTAEIKKRKAEIEEARLNVEKAMLAEYKTFANKIFLEVKEEVNDRVKKERDNLINTREMIAKELEEVLSRVEQLEKQNKVLVTKAGEREAFIRAEIGKENEVLKQKIAQLEETISEKDQHIALISENPNVRIKEKKSEIKPQIKKEGSKEVVEGEFSFDDENKFNAGFDGPVGRFDENGNYRYDNGTYYDSQGFFHDENGNVFDLEGKIISEKTPSSKTSTVVPSKIILEDEFKVDFEDDFSGFDEKKPEEKEIVEETEVKEPVKEVEPESKTEKEAEPAKKRGRPRKEVVEEEQPKPARKRGRPRKEVVEEEQPKPARKRGRPRKEVVEEEQPKPARKRGRPRKEVIEEEQPKSARKRGRPRKEVVEEVKPKSQRGRPKKAKVETVEKKTTGKRGRPRKEKVEVVEVVKKPGRPKKINIDDLKEIEIKLKKQNDILKEQHKELKRTLKKVTKK